MFGVGKGAAADGVADGVPTGCGVAIVVGGGVELGTGDRPGTAGVFGGVWAAAGKQKKTARAKARHAILLNRPDLKI